jgi:hypothetical protein
MWAYRSSTLIFLDQRHLVSDFKLINPRGKHDYTKFSCAKTAKTPDHPGPLKVPDYKHWKTSKETPCQILSGWGWCAGLDEDDLKQRLQIIQQ